MTREGGCENKKSSSVFGKFVCRFLKIEMNSDEE
jgi:hypothetical protein